MPGKKAPPKTAKKAPPANGELKPHPLAALLPSMSDAEYAALKSSIADNGLIEDIVLADGSILDGRHRYRACRELGIEPRTIHFNCLKFGVKSALEYVMAKANPRSMTDGQRAWSAVQFADEIAADRKLGRPADNAVKSDTISGNSRDIAALRFCIATGQVANAAILRKSAPKLFARLGTDRAYNVNRAMQEYRRGVRAREVARQMKSVSFDLSAAELILGDCVEKLDELPAKSARVIFADPPYNIGKKYHADPTGDALRDEEYLAWCLRWIENCSRILADDGSIFIMINGLYAGRVEHLLRQVGLRRRNIIYWWENNPENQKGNFSDAVRQIHYFVKTPAFIFNDEVRVPSRRNKIADKRGLPEGKLPDNVWIDGRIPGNSLERPGFADAPPQLPLAIPETCILVASNPGDTVLDPFNGNGTTGIAALVNGRKYIGIDRSAKYIEQSRKWIASEVARINAKE